jgi:hypothetical protein
MLVSSGQKLFDDYCLAMGIKVEHSVPHVHTQNGLVESLIKRIKWIARPLLQNCRLPTSCWGHAVLHAAALTQLRTTAYHEPPLTAGAWERTKYFPSAYIWQHCVRANTTASAYINGSPPEVGDLCWLLNSVHNQVLRTYDWGSSYSSVRWLCLRLWRPFPNIRGRGILKNVGKLNGMQLGCNP